jgi:hypothetical protein
VDATGLQQDIRCGNFDLFLNDFKGHRSVFSSSWVQPLKLLTQFSSCFAVRRTLRTFWLAPTPTGHGWLGWRKCLLLLSLRRAQHYESCVQVSKIAVDDLSTGFGRKYASAFFFNKSTCFESSAITWSLYLFKFKFTLVLFFWKKGSSCLYWKHMKFHKQLKEFHTAGIAGLQG